MLDQTSHRTTLHQNNRKTLRRVRKTANPLSLSLFASTLPHSNNHVCMSPCCKLRYTPSLATEARQWCARARCVVCTNSHHGAAEETSWNRTFVVVAARPRPGLQSETNSISPQRPRKEQRWSSHSRRYRRRATSAKMTNLTTITELIHWELKHSPRPRRKTLPDYRRAERKMNEMRWVWQDEYVNIWWTSFQSLRCQSYFR